MKTIYPIFSILACSFIFNLASAQFLSPYITVDQFGYLPAADKVAVIRNPIIGYDESETYAPGTTYALVNATTNEQVMTGDITPWSGGDVDESSGDQAWWFDFSSYSEQGAYYVLDIENNTRSHEFWISTGVYNIVLKQAMRTFFYQRAGHDKFEPFADAAWADGASHIGPLQDKNCRFFDDPNNAATERDLSGGWYDAGDYNKYTNWTANYVVEFMKAYMEKPEIWTDDFNIPESGNGIPDILDEAKWGIDHLIRMQNDDGSVLCIVSLAHASPPSSATGQSLYGPETTSATLNTAAAFALSSKVYRMMGETEFADELQQRAIDAWDWAVENPEVLFKNNDPEYGSEGIGAGQQEESEYQRAMSKLEVASYLFEITQDTDYRDFFDANYTESHLIQWYFAYPFETGNQEIMLHYTTLEGATNSVSETITSRYQNAMVSGSENFPAYFNNKDPYRAHLNAYTWGSNGVKSSQANMYLDLINYDIDESLNADALKASEEFLHYLHGVNPQNMTYLSNMYAFGGDSCVNEFYHSWFSDGSPLWDRVGESMYGPAPGYLTGGPNPSYDWDGCCPSDCGSANNNAKCDAESITPPKDQPAQKAYKDFNTSWPLNSWSVTENSCGYQHPYIRMLSKFVNPGYDCGGELNGNAFFDICGNCSGGNTGIMPITDPENCGISTSTKTLGPRFEFNLYPNPASSSVTITTPYDKEFMVSVIDTNGVRLVIKSARNNTVIGTQLFPPGVYTIVIAVEGEIISERLVVE